MTVVIPLQEGGAGGGMDRVGESRLMKFAGTVSLGGSDEGEGDSKFISFDPDSDPDSDLDWESRK